LFSDASRRRAFEYGALLARAQAPPVKKQRTGFTDENQAWLKPKARRGAAAELQAEAEPGGDSDSGARAAPCTQPHVTILGRCKLLHRQLLGRVSCNCMREHSVAVMPTRAAARRCPGR